MTINNSKSLYTIETYCEGHIYVVEKNLTEEELIEVLEDEGIDDTTLYVDDDCEIYKDLISFVETYEDDVDWSYGSLLLRLYKDNALVYENSCIDDYKEDYEAYYSRDENYYREEYVTASQKKRYEYIELIHQNLHLYGEGKISREEFENREKELLKEFYPEEYERYFPEEN